MLLKIFKFLVIYMKLEGLRLLICICGHSAIRPRSLWWCHSSVNDFVSQLLESKKLTIYSKAFYTQSVWCYSIVISAVWLTNELQESVVGCCCMADVVGNLHA